jgi:hypothetical protein
MGSDLVHEGGEDGEEEEGEMEEIPEGDLSPAGAEMQRFHGDAENLSQEGKLS